MRECEARQYSDQMHCKKCNLTWDMNDLDPPKCKEEKEESEEIRKARKNGWIYP